VRVERVEEGGGVGMAGEAGRRVVPTVGVLLLAAALAAGCTSSGSSAPQATTSAQSLKGEQVHVLGLWSGPELDNFMKVKSAWEANTGGVVAWQATQDPTAALAASAPAEGAPDIAVLPNLELMQQLAAQHKLVALDSVLDMKQVDRDYAPAWINLGSYNDKLYGIFYKVTDKATVWYNPKAFAAANYAVPKTWKDMVSLADKMVADGRTPFSVVAASGPANGWALTDWISEIVLNNCGPDVYDRWISAKLPWTDACIKQSFDMFDTIVRTKGYVLGGAQRITSTTDAAGGDPLYTNPPSAYMYHLASFAQGFIAANFPKLTAGTDYSFFPFPAINPKYSGSVAVGADIVVMTHDTPAARSFMAYLAGAPAQEAWIKLGGFTSVNRSVPPDTYPDPVARAIAKQLTDAKVIRFSAGDMMPAALQRAWWSAMLDLVNDPGKLDSILDSLTSSAQDSG
jgi:alpha-glucoside transport system substrate-binding protein